MKNPELSAEAFIAGSLTRIRKTAAKHAKSLKIIEERLGLKGGFVQGLLDETDDWAFIIKTSVLVESALGQILGASLINDALDRHIRSLPMDGRMGKIQLAQDLCLIGPKSAARFRAICEVRNDFAHGLRVLRLSLPDYFSQMNEADFDLLVTRFYSSDNKDTAKRSERKSSPKGGVKSESQCDGRVGRYLFWTSACLALLELSEVQCKIDADRNWRNAMVELGHAFIARQQGDETTAKGHMREALKTLEYSLGSL